MMFKSNANILVGKTKTSSSDSKATRASFVIIAKPHCWHWKWFLPIPTAAHHLCTNFSTLELPSCPTQRRVGLPHRMIPWSVKQEAVINAPWDFQQNDLLSLLLFFFFFFFCCCRYTTENLTRSYPTAPWHCALDWRRRGQPALF